MMAANLDAARWAFPVAVTLHNLEEAIWLPSFSRRYFAGVSRRVSPLLFRAGLLLVTAAAYFITFYSLSPSTNSIWSYLFIAYMFTMLLNVFVPHIAAVIALRSYAPGIVTAVLFILPVTLFLLAGMLRRRYIQTATSAILTLGFPLLAAFLAAHLFLRAGRSRTS